MKRFTLFFACLFLSIGTALAQQKVVSGIVISAEDNQPVIGASVIAKGFSGVGAQTDIDGKFSFTAPAAAKTIVVTYIGLQTQEVAISANMRIVMKPEAKLLDEVIVVAFGKAKKSAFTGSAVQINSKDLAKSQVSNVTNALAGKVPGVVVTSGNNQPGYGSTLRIRGEGSFSAGKAPLYVVDGVPFDGDIASINSQDIESTTVLKDAASAALYGARGANGVILIQTKSGQASRDKINLNFEARFGFNQRGVKDYDYITDPKVYAAKYFESIYNYAKRALKDPTHENALAAAERIYFSKNPKQANLAYHPFTAPEGLEHWFNRQSNGSFVMDPSITVGTMYTAPNGEKYWLQPDRWSDEVFSTNPRQEYNLSLSGRSDKTSYYLSAGYLNDKGYIVSSSFERFTTRMRGDYQLTDRVKIGANLGYTRYISNSLSETDEGGNSANIFAVTNYIAPVYPLYVRDGEKNIMIDKFGNQVYDFGTGEYKGLTRPFLNLSNPMALYKLDKNESNASVISARGFAEFKLLQGLNFTANIGYDHDDTQFLNKRNMLYGQNAGKGLIYRATDRTASINAQQLLTYNRSFGKHNFDALLGHEFYYSYVQELYGRKSNFYYPDNDQLSGAINEPTTNSSKKEYATEGYLGRVQYDYDSKYFGQFSYRRDASSRFHKDHRWGDFWSLGASWLISKEDFMKDLKQINMLKLKVSYGMQGNDAIGSFRYMDLYALRNANNQLAISFYSKGNKEITWETSSNLNAGIEFGIFDNRLSGSVDVYSREVSDMLFWRPVPRSAGYSGYYDNVGSMKNSGLDIELRGDVIRTNNIVWNIYFNAGIFKNKLTKLPEEWEAEVDGYRDGTHVYKVGGSIYDRAIPHYLGVNDQGKPTWQTYDKEKNEYGVTDDYNIASEKENRIIIKDWRPKWAGGFGTSLDLYGVDFSANFSYALGGRIYDSVYAELMHGGTSTGQNFHKDILNSWTPENKNTDIPMVDYAGRFASSVSDRFLISRSYLAINNLTIGYTLPKNLSDAVSLKRVRVYFVGDNLALFSARQGFDPRFGGGVGYKSIRTFSAGVQVAL